MSISGKTIALQDDCSLVIFGATGDLTHRKLLPGLYTMFARRLMPRSFAIVAVARREYTDASYRDWIRDSIRKFVRIPVEAAPLEDFLSRVFYFRSDVETEPDAFERFRNSLPQHPDWPDNHLYYLSVKPDLFPSIIKGLRDANLVNRRMERPWRRVVIEKPFGHDLKSALQLNDVCRANLDERQIFRIDHYLGKETVQNILSFRFANAIFEPLFNNRLVDHVQITAAETGGMDYGRGAYYDSSGAVRDMVQNHMLQLLCLVAMEPPARMVADAIRNEKVKVLQSIEMPAPGCVSDVALPAQYTAGIIDGKAVPGYRQEDRVNPESRTPTYVALRFHIENWRWAGVPFYVRTGKRMAKRATEVVVQFKHPPLQLFQAVEDSGEIYDLRKARPNRLIFRIQPEEGISLRFSAKRPVLQLQVEDVNMDFSYSGTWKQDLPEAYERLLLDVLRGDQTLFTRSDEVESAWRVVDPILRAWEHDDVPIYEYPAGSWGPAQAEALFKDIDTEWHVPR